MNERRFKDFLMLMTVSGNDYGSTAALVKACEEANRIPESEWNRRKAAFNEVATRAPLRDNGVFAIVHSDIPDFFQNAWLEFCVFQQITRGKYTFETFMAEGQTSPNVNKAVADHVVSMQAQHGFTYNHFSIYEVVEASATLLNVTLNDDQLAATCGAVLKKQKELGKDAEASASLSM